MLPRGSAAGAAAGPRSLVMVAGEASGDLLGSILLAGGRARWPELTSAGIGGPAMQREGFDAWWPSRLLAVRGYVEVLRHYRGIVRVRDQLRERVLRDPPSLFVGIDAPDFNLRLEAQLREAGVRTAHFVCPSIWAWRPERIELLRRAAGHVLCIFPFEPALLAGHGIAATYVGHPLAAHIPATPDRAAARRALGLRDDAQVVALLPGSRASEIEHHTLRFVEAARHMARLRPALEFVLPAVPELLESVQREVARIPLQRPVRVVAGQSHTVMSACDVALVASGTATLEAALFKRPMVIAYHMHPISWWIMRRKRLQPWVGLPNILCEDFVVPELLQEAATPEALAEATQAWLDEPERVERAQRRFAQLHDELRRDTARLATDALEQACAAPNP